LNHIPRPEYPRPQFRRSGCIYLNGEWVFAFDDKGAGFMQGWQRTTGETLRSGDSLFSRRINVPFCYQAELSGLGHRTFHDVIWSRHPPIWLHDELRGYNGRGRDSQHTRYHRLPNCPEVHNRGRLPQQAQGIGKTPPPVRSGGLPMHKEQQTKDDGRYIIFYTFEDEESKLSSKEEGAGS
jgi:hypothetical protein